MWKEGKLWLQSTDKAKHENRKGILKSCQQEGSLCALCLRLWDLKCSFVFFPLLTQTTTWQVSQRLRSSFFFLGVAVLPPLEVELMGLLCLEGRFLFWSSFTSAWKHSLCLLSDCLHSSDHCQLSPRLSCDIRGPYMGMFGVEHSELAEPKI